MELLLASALLVTLVSILVHYSKPSLLSPVYAVLSSYVLVFGLGGLLYDPAYGGGGARFESSPEESSSLTLQVAWILCAFTAGAIVSRMRSKTALVRPNFFRYRQLTGVQATVFLCFCIVSLVLLVLGNGPGKIIWRDEYLPEANHMLKIVGTALWPIATLACGAVSTSHRAIHRYAAITVCLVSLLIALALNTRFLCFVPVLFFVGAFILDPRRKLTKVALLLSLLISPFLIVIPLTGRHLSEQGLTEIPSLLTELSDVDMNRNFRETLNNIFLSQPLTIASIRSAIPRPEEYVMMCVTPLPGFMTDWDNAQVRINVATPFNAIGDLLRAGTIVGCSYFFVIGFYFSYVDGKIRKASKPNVETLALMSLSYLFIVLSMQYPLRNASRAVYYSMGVILLGKIYPIVINSMVAPRRKSQEYEYEIESAQ